MALNTALQNRRGRWLVYLYPHDVAERAERLLQIGQPVAAAQLKALGASRLLDAQGRSDFLPGHPVHALLLPSPLFPGFPNDHPQDASLPKHVEPGDSMI